jgi:hypothetical protein
MLLATVGKRNLKKMLSVLPSTKGGQTVVRTTSQNRLAMAKLCPFSFFRTSSRAFAMLQLSM